jgi:hypothetical protein
MTVPCVPGARMLDLRITAGQETGFLVWENAEILAAFSSAAEVAQWIETRLRGVERSGDFSQGSSGAPFGSGGLPGRPQDTEHAQRRAGTGPRDLPAVVLRPRTQPRMPWLRRVTG